MSDDRQFFAIQWPEEPPTARCSIFNFTKSHWESLGTSYEMLGKRLGLEKIQVPRLAVDAGSTRLYDEIRDGFRHMAWCPSGIDLLSNIFPMLMRRSIALDLPTKIDKGFMLELMAVRRGAWMLWSEKPREEERHHQSGVFVRLPSAIQLVYLIVWSISMVEDKKIQPSAIYPFGSNSSSELRYIRSSTLDEKNVIGVAYVPGRAVLFEAFPINEPPSNLVTPDILLL
jgi:hypothetical protein